MYKHLYVLIHSSKKTDLIKILQDFVLGFRKLNLLQIFGCSVHFSRYLYRSAAHPQEIKHGNVVYDFVFKKSVQKICRSSKPIYLGSKPGYFNFFHVYIHYVLCFEQFLILIPKSIKIIVGRLD